MARKHTLYREQIEERIVTALIRNVKMLPAELAYGYYDMLTPAQKVEFNKDHTIYEPKVHLSNRALIFGISNPSKDTILKTVSNKRDDISFGIGLSSDKPFRLSYMNNVILIEVPLRKSLWTNIYQKDIIGKSSSNFLASGLKINGSVSGLSIDDGFGSAFFSGMTRSGKTNSQMGVSYSVALSNIGDILPIDVSAKRGQTEDGKASWHDFNGCESTIGGKVVTDAEDGIKALAWGYQQIIKRSENTSLISGRKIIIPVDETIDLLSDPRAEILFNKIVTQGGFCGVHILGATQYATVDAFGKEYGKITKRNFTDLFCFRASDSKAAEVMSGVAQSGAESLASGGDGLMFPHSGSSYRFTSSYLTIRDFDRLNRGGSRVEFDIDDIDVDKMVNIALNKPEVEQKTQKRQIDPCLVALTLKHEIPSEKTLRKYAKKEIDGIKIGSSYAQTVVDFTRELVICLEKYGIQITLP